MNDKPKLLRTVYLVHIVRDLILSREFPDVWEPRRKIEMMLDKEHAVEFYWMPRVDSTSTLGWVH